MFVRLNLWARTGHDKNGETKMFQERLARGGAGLLVLRLQGAMPVEGGMPILLDGKLIGALGVSGGSSEEDEACAQAGAAALG